MRRERDTYIPPGLEEANYHVAAAYEESHGAGSCGKPPAPAGGSQCWSLKSQSPHHIETGE